MAIRITPIISFVEILSFKNIRENIGASIGFIKNTRDDIAIGFFSTAKK